MSVNLTYLSATEVSKDVKARIEAAATKLNESPAWWCEGINFFDAVGHEGKLTGSTKMFFSGGYDTGSGEYVEVESADDNFMAARDANLIVAHLSQWSREYELEWVMRCAGEEVGRIADGQPDARLRDFLKSLAVTAAIGRPDIEVGSAAGERLARELDAKYASRWP